MSADNIVNAVKGKRQPQHGDTEESQKDLGQENRRLKQQNTKLREEVRKSQSRPSFDVILKGPNLELREQVKDHKKQTHNIVIFSEKLTEGIQTLAPLIRPMMQIARAAALGTDITKRRIQHQKNPEYEPGGKKPEFIPVKDAKGNPVYKESTLDQVTDLAEKLQAMPAYGAAIKQIRECIESLIPNAYKPKTEESQTQGPGAAQP